MTSRPVIGRTRIGLLNTMFSASSSPTWAAVGLPDSRSFRKGCIVIPPIAAFQGRMSGRHLKLRFFILHSLRPLRTSVPLRFSSLWVGHRPMQNSEVIYQLGTYQYMRALNCELAWKSRVPQCARIDHHSARRAGYVTKKRPAV